MISLNALSSRRSPIGEVLVKWCVAARQDAQCVTTALLLFQPVNLKVLGLINQMENAYPQRMQTLLLDASRVSRW